MVKYLHNMTTVILAKTYRINTSAECPLYYARHGFMHRGITQSSAKRGQPLLIFMIHKIAISHTAFKALVLYYCTTIA